MYVTIILRINNFLNIYIEFKLFYNLVNAAVYDIIINK